MSIRSAEWVRANILVLQGRQRRRKATPEARVRNSGLICVKAQFIISCFRARRICRMADENGVQADRTQFDRFFSADEIN
ncbi:hypothetical protein X946_4048 [Burkholderia sp. ABCPW 111]|nr:hypothetical protein X946_4048 [Burkholderia sp. ABCPW 111]